jgi:hypothetical protein
MEQDRHKVVVAEVEVVVAEVEEVEVRVLVGQDLVRE